ncbi:RES family NAD+ phosphorylase [Pollutimonas sp. M17]|uniref:RES family NAD+ phosphorylase n=1 Tax=Pollutimonas sp. M17 TaxID=2962065 RepID=UPI0021F4D0B6|nr:RES family NAD+ phosphorylase [Pollutimonas sp. M17]UYO95396.1 RES family NAD+ phosphorylase [Pollutimonas sp. M17]
MRLPPLSQIRQHDTCRLLPSRFADAEDSVLAPLADSPAHLADLFALDNATNQRLAAERGLAPGIGIDELVFGVPNFRIVNAAYTYPRPEGSRFNSGLRGAWYCAFDVDTAIAEIVFHKTVEYAEIGHFRDSVDYQLMLADFSGQFHDLRRASGFRQCLDPESYVASQALAESLLENGSLGLVYPSVRRAGGVNLACFRPALVNNVRRDAAYRLSWSGTPEPAVKAIKAKSKGKKIPRRPA